MVRITLLTATIFTIASFLSPTTFACESECRIYPVKFLVEKYAGLIQNHLNTLPTADRARAEPIARRSIQYSSSQCPIRSD
ncbi:hypothetical protein BGX23_000672 [Mortierella sp. AD031]|nr:hypothetical protein BGX23_000672 [Mortierella sp. AD031]